MPENTTTVIDPSTAPALIFIYLMIITFWGEPDLLDMAISWMGR